MKRILIAAILALSTAGSIAAGAAASATVAQAPAPAAAHTVAQPSPKLYYRG